MANIHTEKRPRTEEWLEEDNPWRSTDDRLHDFYESHDFSCVPTSGYLVPRAPYELGDIENRFPSGRSSYFLSLTTEGKRSIGYWDRPSFILDIDLVKKFRRLVEQWRQETLHLSSYIDKLTHIAYYQIVGMGPPVVPLILRELQERGGHWFLALTAITCEDPIRPEDAGNMKQMTQAWLEWGKQRRLI